MTTTPTITVLGLGAGDLNQLPYGVYQTLQQAKPLFLRTKEHPLIPELEQMGVTYQSFDSLYESYDQFEKVYETIVQKLLEAAKKEGRIYYAVPGHPLVAEQTVQLLLERERKKELTLHIEGGQSFLDPIFTALSIDPNDGFQLLDATAFQSKDIVMTQHVIISQLYDQIVASSVKLTLMEKYPDDYEVTLVTQAGGANEQLKRLKLYELDREITVDNVTALYVPPVTEKELLYHEFSTLKDVIHTLRSPEGCPWDREQTHHTLKKYLIEETYEVIDAIDREDDEHLQEELGDVLLQVMLHAEIGEENGYFNIYDVIETLTEKMIRRHPHVFGNKKAETAEDVAINWEQIKQEEKKAETSLLSSVSSSISPIMRAYELQKQAAKVGFDWKEIEPVWEKVKEELKEFQKETKNRAEEAMKKEFGDVLFALVNLGRFYRIHPEEALHMTNRKFEERFAYIETEAKKRGDSLEQMTLAQMDALWEEAKGLENGGNRDENR